MVMVDDVLHHVMVRFHVVHLVRMVKVLEHRFAIVVAVRHDALAHHVVMIHHVIFCTNDDRKKNHVKIERNFIL